MDNKASVEMIKAVHEDKSAEINGREYKILTFNHHNRLKVFAYFTKVQHQIQAGNFEFMGTDEWPKIEKLICDKVSLDDVILSKTPKHFEEYAEDYLIFISTMMGAISFPFLKGNLTD